MLRVCTPRFLALVGHQKVFLQSTLRMLLELVLKTSPHPFDSLFSKLGCHNGELGTHLLVVLCLAGFCKGAKLEIGAGMGLIC